MLEWKRRHLHEAHKKDAREVNSHTKSARSCRVDERTNVWASCPDCGEDIARLNDPEVDVKLSAHLATCRRDDRPPKRSCRVAREQVKGGTGSCAGHRDTDTHVRQYESSVTSNNLRKSSSIKTST